MAFTVNPSGTDPVHWCSQMALSLSEYGTIPKLLDPVAWREWAVIVVNIPAIAAVNAVRPERFATWLDWAHQFSQSVRLL